MIVTSQPPAACAAHNENNEDGYHCVWAKPTYHVDNYQCLILPGPPECVQAGWSRDNLLGNGRDGVLLNYTWRILYFPNQTYELAVVRIRGERVSIYVIMSVDVCIETQYLLQRPFALDCLHKN